MERKITTRITALTAALAVIAGSAVSCGSKDSDEKGEKKTAKELLSATYRATEIETDVKFGNVRNITKIDEDTILIDAFDYENKSISLYTTDTEFTSFNTVNVDLGLKDGDDVDVMSSVAPDGETIAIVRLADYGDMEKPDYDDPNFDYEHFDFEEFRRNTKYTYKIYCVDIKGNVVSSNDIVGLTDEDSEEPTYVNTVTACGNGKAFLNVYGSDDKNLVVNTDGQVEKELNIEGIDWVTSFLPLSDGTVAVSGSSGMSDVKIKMLDGKSFEPVGEEIKLEEIDGNSMGQIYAGNDDYKFLMNGSTSLYGVSEDGKTTELVNWMDSDLSNGNVSALMPLENDEFVIWYNDYSSSDESNGAFYKLRKCDASELENTKVITLGVMYDDWEVNEKVSAFNKAHDDVRIKVEDYSKYNKYDEENGNTITSGLGQLKKDIVSGKAPDIIVSENTSLAKSLQNKGLFVDLYEFLEKDSELKKDDIMPNILKAGESNGKLYSLAPSFNIETYIAKKKFVDTPDWNFDQMIETYNKLPEGMKLTPIDCKEQIFSMIILTLGDCIDYEKGTCNFDTPEFNKLIDFCDKFPSQEDVINWEDEDSYSELMADDNYINDKVLLSELYLYDFSDYIQETKGVFNNEPLTFVGFPSSNGQGGLLSMRQNFSILSDASDKDLCWNFIKEFFKPADDDENGGMSGFPALRADFEKLADKAMKKPTYVDENGKTVEEDITYSIGDKEITLQPLTQEERDFIVDYIKNTSRTAYDFDPEVEMILEEEFMAYMKGEKTAKEVLDLLQSRISLLVSEQS